MPGKQWATENPATSWTEFFGAVVVSAASAAQASDITATADGAITIRDIVYITGEDTVNNRPKVAKATANADATARQVLGFATVTAADAAPLVIRKRGLMGGFSSLTAKELQYLSTSSAGAITETRPTTVDDIIKPVGIAVSDDTIEININLEHIKA